MFNQINYTTNFPQDTIWHLIMFIKTFIALTIIVIANTSTFYFLRDAECVKVGLKGCESWKESNMISKTGWTYFCFSENTYVHTPNGPRSMAQLRIDDEVMGIDPSTGKNGYSKIQAWLHHDPLATADFQNIVTNSSSRFESSELHNLAFLGEDGKIGYKFANKFSAGDKLVAFPSQAQQVTHIEGVVRKKGLFSPYTNYRNYFVYEQGFTPLGGNEGEPRMILAHALSQVSNPESKSILTRLMMWATNLYSGKYQPESKEIYTHPAVMHMSWLYGSSWTPAHNMITYESHDYYYSSYSKTNSTQAPQKVKENSNQWQGV